MKRISSGRVSDPRGSVRGTDAEDPLVRDDPFLAVVRDDPDVVPALDAHPEEPRAEALGKLGELRVA